MLTYVRIDGVEFHAHADANGAREVVRADGLLGIGTPRDRTRARQERHGSTDRTRFLGDKVWTLEGEVWGVEQEDAFDKWYEIERVLYSMLRTGPKLCEWRQGLTGREFRGMLSLASDVRPPLEEGAAVLRYTAQVRFAAGHVFAQALRSIVGGDVAEGGGGGTYPTTYPFMYGESSGGLAVVQNPGTVETPPLVRVYGPVTSPRYVLVSTGQQVKLVGEIGAGDYVEVDHDARTVKLNGSADRLNMLDTPNSNFFAIPPAAAPATDEVRMLAVVFAAGAHIEVETRDAYA